MIKPMKTYLGWFVIHCIQAMQAHTKRNGQTTWFVLVLGQLLREMGTQGEGDRLKTTTDKYRTWILIIATKLHAIKT